MTTKEFKKYSIRFDVDADGCPRIFTNCHACGTDIIAKCVNGSWTFKLGCDCATEETDFSYDSPISYIEGK